ncbi:MAG: hypothetical protein EBR73_15760 [Rhodobacteraceae bacterium]|nr:hypothetical protein [Paracoccaceae bacterium]
MHASEVVKCPQCGSDEIRATYTNGHDADRVVRQRRCLACQHRWYTAELAVSLAVVGWERKEPSGKSVPVLRVPVDLAVGSDAV